MRPTRRWLAWGKRRELPLCHLPLDNARKVRQVVPWQVDICRHSWISYRLALVNDEARVAREAGNSPHMIWRHYFQLVTSDEAKKYFEILPPIEASGGAPPRFP